MTNLHKITTENLKLKMSKVELSDYDRLVFEECNKWQKSLEPDDWEDFSTVHGVKAEKWSEISYLIGSTDIAEQVIVIHLFPSSVADQISWAHQIPTSSRFINYTP